MPNNTFHGTHSVGALMLLAWLGVLTGCQPPGPRALLQGERLIQKGRCPEAIPVLEQATTLLPRNAQAWNHLGLAQHGAGELEQAQASYLRALSLNPNLAALRYNLGCLHLDRTNLPAAIQELTAYTLLQPNSADARLKLGTALLRQRRLDEAERRFREALELHPRDAEALNNLGIIQVQKRNPREAANYFNLVLAHQPNHGPALLNLAVLQQQALNNRPAALQAYRKYLAAQPRSPDAPAIQNLVTLLEGELQPAAATLATARPGRNVTATPAPPTNRPAAPLAAAPTRPTPAPTVRTSSPPAIPSPATLATARPTPPPAPPSLTAAPTSPATAGALPPASPIASNEPAREESTPTAGGTSASPPANPAQDDPAKRSLLTRINPFASRNRPGTGTADSPASTNDPARVGKTVYANPKPAPPAPPPPPPRYPMQAPAPVKPGNRTTAEPAFARGVEAQQARQPARAVGEYQTALAFDPSYFEAYYNLGVAARDAGQLGLALAAYEGALGLKPDSADARYNFALALRAGGFTLDAADQLQRMLKAGPNDVRVHLSLGNLYSQSLGDNPKARDHYQRVLALNPGHPEAERIRIWLTANP